MEENLLEEMTVLDVHMLCATVDGGESEFADRRIAIKTSLWPCHRFWKNMRRANLGCCFLRGYVHLILALSVFFNVIAFGITKRHCFLYLGIISALVFGLCTDYFRMRIRQPFNIKLGGGFSGAAEMSAVAAFVVSCSGATTVVSSRSGGGIFTIDECSVSASVGSSITFQDYHKTQLMDSTMQIPTFGVSSSSMDWNQTTIRNSGRAGNNFHAMHQDDLSSRPFFLQDTSIDYAGDSSSNPFLDMNQSFLIQQHNHLSFGNEVGDCTFPLPSTSYYDDRSQSYSSPMSGGYRPTDQLHFSNNTAYWNAPAAAAASEEARPVFYSSMPASGQIFKHNLNSNLTTNLNSEGARELGCSTTKKSSISSTSSEHAFKKTPTPTPLPLPTFKVRKEKLGDRITALRQLVAPFGKTDTASVLQEAIEYINFLHGQVLSTPTLKNQHPMHHHQNSDAGDGANKDLRSRGLCLVPIASMHEVASMIPRWRA